MPLRVAAVRAERTAASMMLLDVKSRGVVEGEGGGWEESAEESVAERVPGFHKIFRRAYVRRRLHPGRA